jgi:hypothetical protein
MIHMSNHTKLTPEKRSLFLETLSDTANVTRAAQAIGMARTYMYEVRGADPEFEKAWDAAVQLGTSALEDEATRRASEGWDEPVFYQGEQTGLIRKFSDTLLIFLLKARDPKFRERNHLELTGKDGGAIQYENTRDRNLQSIEQLSARLASATPGPASESTESPSATEPDAGTDS